MFTNEKTGSIMSLMRSRKENKQGLKFPKMKRKGENKLDDVVSKSQNATNQSLQLEITVETYKTLSRLAVAQGVSVEALVAQAVAALAEEWELP